MAWDLWLGPAPERDFDPAYHPFKWRGWWDFGTGALGDIGCHSMDPIFRALKLGHPTSVQASSSRVNKETFPVASTVTYRFPARSADVQATNVHVRGMTGPTAGGVEMPAVKLVWYDGGLRPPRPENLPPNVVMGDNGRLLVGDHGFVLGSSPGDGAGDLLFPESLRAGGGGGATGGGGAGGGGRSRQPQHIPPSPGHFQEWIDACRGGPAAGANFDWAGPLTEAVLLGNVALRPELRIALTKQRLTWDPAACGSPSCPPRPRS
jgi:predicted dehydrogenase